MQSFRKKILKIGLAFYNRWLRETHLGRWMANEIIRREYVSFTEISPLQEASRSQQPSKEFFDEPFINTDVDVPGFHISPPLNIGLSGSLTIWPQINVLLPSLRVQDMSGGPNTALLLAARLAEAGERVRLISTDISTKDSNVTALYDHMDGLLQRPVDRTRITLVDGVDRSIPVMIGANDIFLATAWWTAQLAKYAIRKTNFDRFIYLIQDFEPILHDGSTYQARALETYGLPHIPVVNSRLLLDHLIKEGCGYYSQPSFASEALCFEPAIDRRYYFHDTPKRQPADLENRRVLLFYARPTYARRNLFEIGVAALRKAVNAGWLDNETWEIWGMGEKFDAISLGRNVFLNPLPWMSFEDYATKVRTSDLLLSLMLSPHPSYPPLEMAASGKLVVTNSYSVKTAERLQMLSPNILVAAPSPDSVADVLESAIGRINSGLSSYDPSGKINLPLSWDESLEKVIPHLKERVDALRKTRSQQTSILVAGYPTKPRSEYERFRRRRLMDRRQDGKYFQEAGLLTFITSAYNTDSEYLEQLAGSIFLQDGGTNFEWLLLDNGSTDDNTCKTLQAIGRHPCVRFERVEKNLGIIGGMRYCLERATGRYILPVDSDDTIEPDCVHVLTRFLQRAGYPALIYTDEDKLKDGQFISPYFKPGWDPVLFVHSCYIAHLCAMDREKALALNLYSDSGTEGSHDWDSFIRFINAGFIPLHVPEILYSWRMHQNSTSTNIAAKSYISDSHRITLQRFLDHANTPNIELVSSPLFKYDVDWRFRRKQVDPVSYLSVHIGPESVTTILNGIPEHVVVSINLADGIKRLGEVLDKTNCELVHLYWDDVSPDNTEWFWEAMGLIELFPDIVMVGGILHDGNSVLDGPRIFGFGGGFDCPDQGRDISKPGYFATMWKPHSVSATSTGHCVVRFSFLKNALHELIQEQVPLEMLGPWLGALAKESGKRVVFSPFIRAFAKAVPENGASSESRSHFLSRFWMLMPDDHFFSPRLGLHPTFAYVPVTDTERENHLNLLQRAALAYSDWLEMEIRHRASRYSLLEKNVTLSILTAVYEGSNIMLLDQLAESIVNQTLRPAQWLIVVNGPVKDDDLQYIRDRAERVWGATLIIESQSLGIIGALRRGMEYAQSEYIAPVDADDVLTLDAVQILVHELDRLNYPDLIYSDEDVLTDDKPTAPYLRSAFDPIMNLDSSYIWHLFAIKRETAFKAGVYSDAGANWCQDWDSVTRIANVGGRIEHIPEILYHWRQHPNSTTNKPEGDPRSLDSVRHLLEKQIAVRVERPDLFSVETWPVNRGAKELYIARRNLDLPKFVWMGDFHSGKLFNISDEDAILVVTANGITVEDSKVFNEVSRLFGLHPKVAAVGGRVVDSYDVVVDGCFVINQGGDLESPWVMRNVHDVGPYALAAKPQSIASTGASLAFFRIKAIKELNIPFPDHLHSWHSWAFAACEQLIGSDWMVAYSPLVLARTTKISTGNNQIRPSTQIDNIKGRSPLTRYGNQCPHSSFWAR